jgi:hypothetical protein
MFGPAAVATSGFGSIPSRPGRLRSKFTIEEDDRLKRIIAQHPTRSWREVASFFPGKSARQVRERFKNYLNPDLNHTTWTAEEDALLLEKYAVIGPQWRVLKSFFANRSDVNVKNRGSVLSTRPHHAVPGQSPVAHTAAAPLPPTLHAMQPTDQKATQPALRVSLVDCHLLTVEDENLQNLFNELWNSFP